MSTSAPKIAGPDKKEPMSTGKYLLLLLIGMFVMFVLGRILPTWGGISRVGVQTICIFAATIYMVSAGFGLIVPSMFAMLAIVLSGYKTVPAILSSTFGSTSLYQLFMVYVLCWAISKSGAGAVMARWLLSRKFVNGRPLVFCVMFMEVVSLFASLVGASGAVLFFFTLIDSLCDTLGYDDRSQFKKVLLCGAFISASLGSPTLPFKGTSLLIFGLVSQGFESAGLAINYGSYIVVCLINQLVFAFVIGLCMKPVFRADTSKLKDADLVSIMSDGPTKMNRQQAFCFWGFIIACMYSIILLFPIKEWSGYKVFNSITQCFVFAMMICVLSLVRVDKKPIINPGQAFKEGIRWEIIYAYVAFSTLGGILAADDVGIKAWLSAILQPVFGNMSFMVFCFVIILATTIITNFFSNTATGVIMGALAAPYFIKFAQDIGINPSVIGACIAVSCSVAYMTMGAGNVSAVFLGQKSMLLDKGWVWKWGALMGLFFVIIATIVFGGMSYIL